MMRGYDQYNTLLLPPRNPGDKLPQELLDWDEEETKKQDKSQLMPNANEDETPEDADENGAPEGNNNYYLFYPESNTFN